MCPNSFIFINIIWNKIKQNGFLVSDIAENQELSDTTEYLKNQF